MTSETVARLRLFGGPYDGAKHWLASTPATAWVTRCDCGSCRPCGGVNVMAFNPEPPPAVLEQLAREEGFVAYKRDRLLPDGSWRYVYECHLEPIFQHLIDGVARDRELAAT